MFCSTLIRMKYVLLRLRHHHQQRVRRVLFLSNRNIQVAFKETDNSKSDCFFFYFLLAHSFHFLRIDGALANNFVRVPPKGQARRSSTSHRIASLRVLCLKQIIGNICIKYLFRLRKSSRILSCGFSEPTPVFGGTRKTAGNIKFALITFEQINKFDEK